MKTVFCPQKVAYLWQLGVFFFSAAPTAQNSPELHFRFINSPIQSSVLKSVIAGEPVNVEVQVYVREVGPLNLDDNVSSPIIATKIKSNK